jgi:uncharacterized protein YqeY
MALHETLSQDIKTAMLAKDAERLSALRMLKPALGYAAMEKKTDALSDAEFISVVQKEIKKRRDSQEQFEKGGRAELAAKEGREITYLEIYLPQPLSSEQLEALVRASIAEAGATSKKEMGAVIKLAQAKAAGRADGKTISQLVGQWLP